MKKLFLMLILLGLCVVGFSQQTSYRDVVYLKNGSIIKGTIVEQIPNESVTIETADNSLFVCKMEDITKITKETVVTEDPTLSKNKLITIVNRQYYQDGKIIPVSQLKPILANNSSSASFYNKYKTARIISVPFIIVGSASVLAGAVIELAYAVKKAQDEYYYTKNPKGAIILMGVGLCFEIVGIGLSAHASKNFTRSINQYNASIKSVSATPIQVNFMVNANGFGIRMRF